MVHALPHGVTPHTMQLQYEQGSCFGGNAGGLSLLANASTIPPAEAIPAQPLVTYISNLIQLLLSTPAHDEVTHLLNIISAQKEVFNKVKATPTIEKTARELLRVAERHTQHFLGSKQ